MSNIYLEFVEDKTGDVININYYHNFCAPNLVKEKGGWPCPPELDYPIYCNYCGKRIKEVSVLTVVV